MEIGKISNFPQANNAKEAKKKNVRVLDQEDIFKDTYKKRHNPKKWLVMNYIAAHNDLTRFQLNNINEMEKVGSDDNTHIVSLIDVGDSPKLNVPFMGTRQYYIVKDDDPNRINSIVLDDYFFQRVDSGSYLTLKKFVIETIKNCPATYIALMLNNHGSGFLGAMSDDATGHRISIPELKWVLEEVKAETGKKVDVIGFDACYMAGTEVAYELRNEAKYLVASEESMGGWGLPYGGMLGQEVLPEVVKEIQKNRFKISYEPDDFVKQIVEEASGNQINIPTYSAVKLEKMDPLKDSINELAEAIIAANDKDAVRKAVRESQKFGSGSVPYADLRDIKDIADKLIANIKEPVILNAANKVLEGLKNAVIANENNLNGYSGANGLSIYAPTYVSNYLPKTYESLSFAKDTKWNEALESIMEKHLPVPPGFVAFRPSITM